MLLPTLFTCEIKQKNYIGRWKSSEIISKLFQPRKKLWNYVKISSAILNILENIHELQQASELILK